MGVLANGRRRIRALSCPVLAATAIMANGAISRCSAQETVSERTFFEPLEVRMVNVEVLVNDASGRPVRGLTVDDFSLFEDGTPVEISNFWAAGDLSTGIQAGQEVAPLAVEDLTEAQPLESVDRYLALFVDKTNISASGSRRAFRDVSVFLREQLPTGMKLLMVTFDGQLRFRHGVTDDVAPILTVLDELSGGRADSRQVERRRLMQDMQEHAAMSKNTDTHSVRRSGALRPLELDSSQFEDATRYSMDFYRRIEDYSRWVANRNRVTFDAIERFVRSLSGLPGHKAVLYIGDGIETVPGQGLYHAWEQSYPQVIEATGLTPGLDALKQDTSSDLRRLMEYVNGQRVSIYNLNTSTDRYFNSISADAKGFPGAASFDSQRRITADEAVVSLAVATGGRTMVNNRHLDDQLAAVATELGSYYSLGFVPTHSRDGAYHRIRVSLTGGGYQLRHREGYRDRSAVDRVEDATLAAAVIGEKNNSMHFVVEPQSTQPRPDGNFTLPVQVRIPLREIALLPQGEEHRGLLAVLVVVRDSDGGLSDILRREIPIAVPNSRVFAAMSQNADIELNLVMKPGPQRLAVGVCDVFGESESTEVLDIDVGSS